MMTEEKLKQLEILHTEHGCQYGCRGRHNGDGSPGCPRTLHHHHDERCVDVPNLIAAVREAMAEIDRLEKELEVKKNLAEIVVRQGLKISDLESQVTFFTDCPKHSDRISLLEEALRVALAWADHARQYVVPDDRWFEVERTRKAVGPL